jgi:hypothetical protein
LDTQRQQLHVHFQVPVDFLETAPVALELKEGHTEAVAEAAVAVLHQRLLELDRLAVRRSLEIQIVLHMSTRGKLQTVEERLEARQREQTDQMEQRQVTAAAVAHRASLETLATEVAEQARAEAAEVEAVLTVDLLQELVEQAETVNLRFGCTDEILRSS